MSVTPENTRQRNGVKEVTIGRRGDVSGAEQGDGGHPGHADARLPLGGPRRAYVAAALVGFLAGRKRGLHSTGIERAGGKRRIACEHLDLRA